MKAIILTYDRYRTLTEHMIARYDELWPDHPFCFRIPFQNSDGPNSSRREYIQSPSEIKSTVLKLLEDLPDEEWIYWCIDDKYPISLNLEKIKEVLQWIKQPSAKEASAVLFCRTRKMFDSNFLQKTRWKDESGNVYLQRKGYRQIWIHQFLRVKVIRRLFEQFPDDIPNAKTMDKLKNQLKLPSSHRLLVTEKNMAIFGESTSRGKLTANCYQSMLKSGLNIPNNFSIDHKNFITMGKWEYEGFQSIKIFRKLKQLFETDNKFKPIIWVRTPKCAGSSLKRAIRNQNLPIDIIKWGLVSKFIKSKSESNFQNAYKFAVVRNPFDRFVSSYHYCIQKGWLDKGVSFKEFAKIPWEDIENGPYPKGPVIPVNKVFQHTRPLHEHLSHDFGKCDYIDEFIHLENLESELNDLLKRFSMPPIKLPKLNTSTHRRYQGYYDEETIRYVAEKFRGDLTLFGYSFDSRESED